MHAFVTGATGFCGRHLVAALIARGHRVTALVRPTSNRKGLTDLGVGFVEGDLLEPASYRAAVGEADVVFHLAAQLRTPWRDDFMTTNGDATGQLAEACAQAATPPVFVYVSSLAASACSHRLLLFAWWCTLHRLRVDQSTSSTAVAELRSMAPSRPISATCRA